LRAHRDKPMKNPGGMRRNDTDFDKAGIHNGTLLEVTALIEVVIAAIRIPNLMSIAGNSWKRGNDCDLKGKTELAKMRAA